MDEKELQARYMELKMIDSQLNEIQKQIMAFDEQMGEVEAVKEALDEIKEVKPGTEILVPVTNGIFLKAELKKNDEVLINVGSGAVTAKDIASSKKLLDKQLEDMANYREQLLMTLQKLSAKAQQIEASITASEKKKASR